MMMWDRFISRILCMVTLCWAPSLVSVLYLHNPHLFCQAALTLVQSLDIPPACSQLISFPSAFQATLLSVGDPISFLNFLTSTGLV